MENPPGSLCGLYILGYTQSLCLMLYICNQNNEMISLL